jgi:peptidyl-prolyl cis-trans isomerase B (cyclophilin B)
MPQSSKKTRERQLAKLAARRAAERRRRRRNRSVALGVGGLAAAAVVVVLFFVFLHNPKTTAAAAARHSPTPAVSASATPTAPAVACGSSVPSTANRQSQVFAKAPKQTIEVHKTYTVAMRTSCGTIVVRFDPKDAPQTVNSLVFLIHHRFFDGLTFHRIARGFVIQGGDPKGNGAGGPGYSTLDPPPANAQYTVGTMAMAKTGNDPAGTAGSQFFIVTGSSAQASLAPGGKGQYAIVGHVTKGMDVVQKIAALPIAGGAQDGAPAQKVYIASVTVKVS